jgi:hypothetical protein
MRPEELLPECRDRHVEQNNRLALELSLLKSLVPPQTRHLLVIHFFVDLDAQRLQKL